jgi:NAD(P)H-hydrate epimerase
MWGSLLVVGGSEIYSGAPTLSSMAAYRLGLDLVYTAVPETAAQAAMSYSPSLITCKLPGERLNPENLEKIYPLLDKVKAVAIGPGLGMADETIDAVNTLVKEVAKKDLPLVLDADGLKSYALNPVKTGTPIIFTPHGREFKLMSRNEATGTHIEKGMIVKETAKKLGGIVLLKGEVDIISDGKHTRYNWSGNPGMTVGGTGDVLTGLVGGYLAQSAKPFYAACAGAYLNGRAGDNVYEKKGYHILPEDLLNEIPIVVEDCISHRV